MVVKLHHGTHYSNSAGVMHYLVRVEPFYHVTYLCIIDALQSANEEFVKFIRAMGYSSGVTQVYAEFVETWCSKLIDESLV